MTDNKALTKAPKRTKEPVIGSTKGICNRACVSVKYLPPSLTKPARWVGKILRGKTFRISVHALPEELTHVNQEVVWVAEQTIELNDLFWEPQALTFHKGEYVITV